MNSKGNLFIISGFSGSGKGTLVKRLTAKYDNCKVSVSVTSRAPRVGEVDGKDYHFITHAEFEQMALSGKLLEYAIYVKHGYGTPAGFVDEQVNAGNDVILEIEMQGALQVKSKMPEATLIFITPPSAEELRRRLCARGTETQEVIDARLARAYEESAYMEQYEYILVNDDLDVCTDRLHAIMQTVRDKVSSNTEFIEQIKTNLKAFEQ